MLQRTHFHCKLLLKMFSHSSVNKIFNIFRIFKGNNITLLSTNNIEGNFQISSRPAVISGQCFGVFPVQGYLQDTNTLQFKWRSIHTIRSLLSILATALMTIFSIEWLLDELSVPRASLYIIIFIM